MWCALDSVWLCKLNERGMLRPSFVPPAAIRDLRQLTRLRAVLVAESSRHRNRIEKVLEDALLKISSVLSDMLGLSGRRILNALVAGQGSAKVPADLAHPRVRASRTELLTALTGQFRDVHATEIKVLLELIDTLQAKIDQLDSQITALITELPGAHGVCTSCGVTGTAHAPTCPDLALPILSPAERFDEITGVGLPCAHVIIAELGTGVAAQFPTAGHAAAWARLVPLADQSGATTKPGRTGNGNRRPVTRRGGRSERGPVGWDVGELHPGELQYPLDDVVREARFLPVAARGPSRGGRWTISKYHFRRYWSITRPIGPDCRIDQ